MILPVCQLKDHEMIREDLLDRLLLLKDHEQDLKDHEQEADLLGRLFQKRRGLEHGSMFNFAISVKSVIPTCMMSGNLKDRMVSLAFLMKRS